MEGLDTAAALWGAVVLSGIYHGVNPGMVWPLPVSSAPLDAANASPPRPLGRGGRNVDFLMGLAGALDGAPGIWACAADTDGVDGLEDIAGAILTPDTLSRAPDGLYHSALDRFDGHGFFARRGDQVITGPTLTNVNDFRAILVL